MAKSPILNAMLGTSPDPPKKKRILGIFSRPKFDTVDKALLAASTLALAGDWLTTIDGIRRREEGFVEYNPILGRTPSVGDVNAYTGAVALGNALIASQLPPKARKAWLAGFTAIELATMLGNRRAGLKFNLNF